MNIEYIRKQLAYISKGRDLDDFHSCVSVKDSRILQRADELCEHIFVFDDTWDMEPCTIPFQMENIDWNKIHNEDEEWVFMLNRMSYLRHLVLAYFDTNSIKYVDTWKEITSDWIAKHPVITNTLSTRTLDTAIRCTSMLEGCASLHSLLTDDEVMEICTSIINQLTYLKEAYIPKYTLSNWGFIQTAAILECLPILLEDYKIHPLYTWALQEFQTQIQLQILDDGMHWEQSTMYHVEVLYSALRVLRLDKLYDYGLTKNEKKRIHKMATALRFLNNGNHQIDAYGDSDVSDLEDILNLCAILFQDNTLRIHSGKPMSWWLFYETGISGFTYLNNTLESHPDTLVYEGKDCGIITIRDDWDHPIQFTQFDNSRLGSSHGHSDHLHISLYYKHQPILIDSGRYTYREDHPLRPYLKSMAAHNTIIVDNMPVSIPKKSWEYDSYAMPLKNYLCRKHNKTYMEGTIRNPHYSHTRKVIIPYPGIWVIVDEVYAAGSHEATGYFHYHPSLRIKKLFPSSYSLCTDKINLITRHEQVENITFSSSPHSLRYNEISEHPCIQTKQSFQDTMVQLTWISEEAYTMRKEPIYQDEQKEAASSLAHAITFQISEKESITVVIFHKEIYKGRKLCICRGIPLYGECCILHEIAGKIEISRLKV